MQAILDYFLTIFLDNYVNIFPFHKRESNYIRCNQIFLYEKKRTSMELSAIKHFCTDFKTTFNERYRSILLMFPSSTFFILN